MFSEGAEPGQERPCVLACPRQQQRCFDLASLSELMACLAQRQAVLDVEPVLPGLAQRPDVMDFEPDARQHDRFLAQARSAKV